MKNKKALLPRQGIQIVIIIGMLIFAVSSIISGWNDRYSQIENSEDYSSYNSINDMATASNEMQNKLKSDTQPQTIGWLDFIVTGGYQVLISTLSIPLTLGSFVYDIGGEFNIPNTYITGFVVLIAIGAIFGIIGALFRRKV